MKAVILSAGRGSRLLPLTKSIPKCALPINGRPILLRQIDTLLEAGIKEVVVVVGYGADKVAELLSKHHSTSRVRTLYNPFFQVSDNLASCWLAGSEMDADFLLINGDTVCELEVVRSLLSSPAAPITLAIDRKPHYDSDDMRVQTDGDRLIQVGKHLVPKETDGESIGISLYRGSGPARFRWALERAVRRPEGLKQWYLSVVDELAGLGFVSVHSIQGLRWAEIDTPADLAVAAKIIGRRNRAASE